MPFYQAKQKILTSQSWRHSGALFILHAPAAVLFGLLLCYNDIREIQKIELVDLVYITK